MTMQAISLIFPAAITLGIALGKDTKNKKTLLDIMIRLCIYAIIINVSVMSVISFVLNKSVTITALESFRFFIFYTVMASCCALFIGIIERQMKRRISGENKHE